jgi:hypothetical protein
MRSNKYLVFLPVLMKQKRCGFGLKTIDHFTVPCAILKGNQAFASKRGGVDLAMIETCE